MFDSDLVIKITKKTIFFLNERQKTKVFDIVNYQSFAFLVWSPVFHVWLALQSALVTNFQCFGKHTPVLLSAVSPALINSIAHSV
jgi:hypothetical protein